MSQVVTLALSILSFLVSNKSQIVQVITEIELLIPDAPGATKAAAVESFIAASLGAEAQIEQAWPLVGPLFNALVSLVKPPKAV